MDLAGRARIAKPENLDRIMEYSRKAHENQEKGQTDLFAGEASNLPPLELEETEPWTMIQALEGERKSVGFYLSGHPLEHDPYYKLMLFLMQLNEIKRQNDLKYGSHLLNRPKEMRGVRRNGYKSR